MSGQPQSSTPASASQSIKDILQRGSITALFHPTGYAKVLIQLGHEPFAPVASTPIFGFWKERLYYPNVFKYVGHIYRMDGFFGLYRGLVARLIAGSVGTAVQSFTQEQLTERCKELTDTIDEDSNTDWIKVFFIQTSQESVSRCLALVASQPFHVIMVRQMAQFVGGEKIYDGLFGSMAEIYNNEGIIGFFSGLVPRLVGEIITIWASNLVAHLLNKYLIESKEMRTYTAAICGLFISQYTYPCQMISNIMAASGAELVATRPPKMPVFTGWRNCCHVLVEQKQIYRGAKLFFRAYTGPTVLREGHLMPSMILY